MTMSKTKSAGIHVTYEGQAGLREPESSGARRCRDCGAVLPEPGRILCQSCKAAVNARRNENRRLCQRKRRARQQALAAAEKGAGQETLPISPHRCVTAGCTSVIEGRARYCQNCTHDRQLRAQREYRQRHYVDPLPFGPPTSMAWLDKFADWTRSGLSYAAYQAAERK
ncbi:hypothetical protein SAMN02745823_03786 [Sporobacter termitidis DSM 10068]|uniref:Uncharacterized protein n=1 Tax=Sporobacter termitidis DSM 10068 TaxID=1123282 RepID=A0A1M5ZHZ4_9FIRM|nr:hypothetical protein [Sporobacter termitidis]SHI23927.1 hypothetical protein SAMN02745823_03786 [Sporobacter termitidis DSM 10068]